MQFQRPRSIPAQISRFQVSEEITQRVTTYQWHLRLLWHLQSVNRCAPPSSKNGRQSASGRASATVASNARVSRYYTVCCTTNSPPHTTSIIFSVRASVSPIPWGKLFYIYNIHVFYAHAQPPNHTLLNSHNPAGRQAVKAGEACRAEILSAASDSIVGVGSMSWLQPWLNHTNMWPTSSTTTNGEGEALFCSSGGPEDGRRWVYMNVVCVHSR